MKHTAYVTATGAFRRFVADPAQKAADETLVQTADDVRPEVYDWSSTAHTWTPNLARAEALAVKQIKAESELRKMAVLSAGGAKKTEYAEKRQDVLEWLRLVGTLPIGSTIATILAAFNALPLEEKQIRFPFAMADAAKMGDTIDKAIARFKAGIAGASSFPDIAAAEQKAIKAARAGTTVAAKQAAATTAVWT